MERLVGPLSAESSVEAIGFGGAVVLLVAAHALVPKEARYRIRIAAVYLALAVVFGILSYFIDTLGTVDRVLLFLYYFFLLASIGRSIVLLAVDVVFGRRIHRAPPRIFRDLTQAVVYVLTALLTLRAVGVEPGSLLTTSALLTAVIGLALQDTLGNLVSGLALQLQRSFDVGDWIQFEPGDHEIGQVTEVNWRATTVKTDDLVEVIVPNSHLAKKPIRNFSRPSPVARRSVTVQAPYDVAPHRVHAAIVEALHGTPGVLVEPAPWVQTKAFADSGIEYAVWFFVDDYSVRRMTDGRVRDRVWYGLQRAGISIPFPIRTVHMHQISEASEKRAADLGLERRDKTLRCVDFLDALPPEVHRALAAAATVRLYAPGEVIVNQGDASSEMFIIDRGEVVVELGFDGSGTPISVARLGSGRFFGEMGLMTGEARKATVRASEQCELLVVGHAAFHDTLAAVPGVIERMSELLVARQSELEQAAMERPTEIDPVKDRSRRLVSQIRDFFKL